LTLYGAGFIDDSATVACPIISMPPSVLVSGVPAAAFSIHFRVGVAAGRLTAC
jgi:hypothetical protein